MMLQFSRAIYRDLVGEIDAGAPCPGGDPRRYVISSCERTMDRLATDRRHFARPVLRLFDDIRICFPLQAQPHVHTVVERWIREAEGWLDEAAAGLDALGEPLRCPAFTRQGEPCRRTPLPEHQGYCPSHRHLAE